MKFKKSILLLSLSLGLGFTGILAADDGSFMGGQQGDFEGVITALDSNGHHPGKCFTAINDQGIVKVFLAPSLDELATGERVELKYRDGAVYPLKAWDIRVVSSSGK